MTKGGRKAGAIICIIGGGSLAFIFVMLLISFIIYFEISMIGPVVMFAAWMACGVIGGIILLKDNWVGGFFPLLAGSSAILFFFLDFQMASGLVSTPSGLGLDAFVLIALILALLPIIGGILGIVFKAEAKAEAA